VVGGGATPLTGAAGAARAHKRGTTFTYKLSQASTARIVISERAPGARKGTRCVAPAAKSHKTTTCTRILVKGTLTRASHAGGNAVAFSGRIGSTALKPGHYEARLTATTANKVSNPQTISFTIVKR